MFQNLPFIGAIIFVTLSAHAAKHNIRSKRAFDFSNPIFSRVFNQDDDRPLTQKFFDYNYNPGPTREDSPQYYPLWNSHPVLRNEEEELNQEYVHPGTTFGNWYQRFFNPHPGHSSSHPSPSKPLHPHPEVGKPYPPPSKPSQPYPETEKPYPPFKPSKPYPETEKPYPPPFKPSQPYPESMKPYPPPFKPSKPYPEAEKPYPPPFKPSQPYPEPSQPQTSTTDPCVDPTKPYPASQQTARPPIGRIFVDEVNKELKFVRNPETGELVPVITEGKLRNPLVNTYVPDPLDFLVTGVRTLDYELETAPPLSIGTTTTETPSTEKQYRFKLLPNYDIKETFNSTTTENPDLIEEKLSTNPEDIKRIEEQDQKILHLLEGFEKKLKVKAKKTFGEDEANWPNDPFHSLREAIKKFKKGKNCTTTTKPPTSEHFEDVTLSTSTANPVYSTTSGPVFILPNYYIRNKFQEEAQKVYMPTTKKPYTNKTSQINPQTTTTKPLRFNIHFKVLDTPKDTPFYFKFRPYTPPTEDYTKFLAPTSHVQYQQIRQSSTEAPFTSPFVNHFYRISPRRGLEFKLFNKKLDQSTLASARDPKTGKIDFSKLEALTHTEYIEPVIRPRTIVRTLDTKPLDVVDRFSQQSDDDSGPFGKHRISRRPLVF